MTKPPRTRRFALIGGRLAVFGIAVAQVLNAFKSKLVFFFTRSVETGEAPTGKPFRLGGVAVKGSLKRQPDGLTVQLILNAKAKKGFRIVYAGRRLPISASRRMRTAPARPHCSRILKRGDATPWPGDCEAAQQKVSVGAKHLNLKNASEAR